MYCFRKEDVAFFAGERQVAGGNSLEIDAVEVRFRGSKGNQGWRGGVLVTVKSNRGKGRQSGGIVAETVKDVLREAGPIPDGVPKLRR